MNALLQDAHTLHKRSHVVGKPCTCCRNSNSGGGGSGGSYGGILLVTSRFLLPMQDNPMTSFFRRYLWQPCTGLRSLFNTGWVSSPKGTSFLTWLMYTWRKRRNVATPTPPVTRASHSCIMCRWFLLTSYEKPLQKMALTASNRSATQSCSICEAFDVDR